MRVCVCVCVFVCVCVRACVYVHVGVRVSVSVRVYTFSNNADPKNIISGIGKNSKVVSFMWRPLAVCVCCRSYG